ncbi:MAG: two component transcriptional regulator, LuxR family [Acidobacteria bacterium]|jgi:DNA-binding NarL/FixJ family response regulator|nr:two component transcriptional regulator, LuxR family [Acidobacteriota bacterium]
MLPQSHHLAINGNLALPLQEETLRIAIAGNDPLARAGLSSILGAFDDLAIIDDLDLDERLVSRLRLLSPDVVVCDLSGENAPALEALNRLGCPSLVLLADVSAASEALSSGARGVVLRSAGPRRLHAALRAVGEGMVVLDEEISPSLLTNPRSSEPLAEPLTAREREVMQLLAAGLTNKEIAQRLGISDHTVKFHVNAILGKLGVTTRTEAVVHAARMGIVVL